MSFEQMNLREQECVASLEVQRHRTGKAANAKTPFSLEWAAGFLDGDGCLSLVTQAYSRASMRKSTYRLLLSVTQNDRPVLEHFQNGLGVASGIYLVKRTLQHNKQVYVLQYWGAHAIQAIKLLEPYLVRKNIEAQVALQYWVVGQCGTRFGPKGLPPSVRAERDYYYKKLQSLK